MMMCFSVFPLAQFFFFYLFLAHDGRAMPEAEEILTNETQSRSTKNDETGKPSSSLFSVPTEQASGYMSTPWKRSQCPLTPTERTRILERVPFKSEKPFFKILMHHKGRMDVPFKNVLIW